MRVLGFDQNLRRQHHQRAHAAPLDLRRRSVGQGFNVLSKPYSACTTSTFTLSRFISPQVEVSVGGWVQRFRVLPKP